MLFSSITVDLRPEKAWACPNRGFEDKERLGPVAESHRKGPVLPFARMPLVLHQTRGLPFFREQTQADPLVLRPLPPGPGIMMAQGETSMQESLRSLGGKFLFEMGVTYSFLPCKLGGNGTLP